jgi:hypothetical protein
MPATAKTSLNSVATLETPFDAGLDAAGEPTPRAEPTVADRRVATIVAGGGR